MRIEIPEFSLIALIGPSSSGKTTFAAKHFKNSEILSSDYFRAVVSDDETNQEATKDAFEVLYYVADKRLSNMKLTVIDATNVQPDARKTLILKAREHDCIPSCIVFNLRDSVCIERNEKRTDRKVKDHTIKNQNLKLRKSIKHLSKEGFRHIFIINEDVDLDNIEIVRTKLWNNKRDEIGPYDLIGDIHGCYDELSELLIKLGYDVDNNNYTAVNTHGRKVVFLGDLTDRGPKNVPVLKLVMNMVASGSAYCVPGNHDSKLLRKLRGKDVSVKHGFEKTIEELDKEGEDFKKKVAKFIDSLVSHYVFDNGKLVAAHAGLKEKYQGRGSGKVRDFCLYGETTGEIDEYGLPVRYNWTNEYRGDATVIYGHTPQVDISKNNNTINIDTGCVFGGKLSAYRYPENEIVSVKSKMVYYEPVKPLLENNSDKTSDDILDITDVLGKKVISTALIDNVIVHEENAAAALEIMSRFAADPHWITYMPPTMSPSATSTKEGYLEYPEEAFKYYKESNVSQVVCEKKHMGSRAVITLCKNEEIAKSRFGVMDNSIGIIYTRTGRSFFTDNQIEKSILSRLGDVLNKTNFWNDFNTDWVILDTELMPWSYKAKTLLSEQYAPVGCSGKHSLGEAVDNIKKALLTGENNPEFTVGDDGGIMDIKNLLSKQEKRFESITKYTQAYSKYCWDVESIDDYQIAPFHILATENNVHNDKNHIWHMETIKKYITGIDKIFIATEYIQVDVNDINSISKGIEWWESLTENGGEGMVIKPYDFISTNGHRLLQPALKCRGLEYLRIIYGPEYNMPENLKRLKVRSLMKKRSLALKEFALGMEGLQRFVNKEPLYKVHECSFAVLAMESEPIDPRL